MAEGDKPTAPKSSPTKSGPKRGPGLAAVQGEYLPRDDDPSRVPGTREHLGDDPVYAGGPSPFVEGEA